MRDGARGRLAERATPKAIEALITLLDAKQKSTRKRSAGILAEVRPERIAQRLRKALADSERSERLRASAARVLTVIATGEDSALGAGLRDQSPRVRRACASVAAPAAALFQALGDADRDVVDRAALSIEHLELTPPKEALEHLQARSEQLPSTLRLLARCDGASRALAAAALEGNETALDHLKDIETWQSLLPKHPVAAAWNLAGHTSELDALVLHPEPAVRLAVARSLKAEDPRLDVMLNDADAGVRWMAERAKHGAFSSKVMAARVAPHEWLEAVSAQPPYGLKKDDTLPDVERIHGALALYHTRFDINLGVAIRSAEAAGLKEVFVVGRSDFFRSPARGTDLAMPVRQAMDAQALIRMAREGDYQLVAVQQTPDSVPYHTAPYPPRPLFVMGAEGEGLPDVLRIAADLVVEIPQFGVIDSLNVAAAATTVLFHWRCQQD